MRFVNVTQMEAGWTMAYDRDGRELIVVAIKGTYPIPESDESPSLSPVQVPLTFADQFTGEPGLSAPHYETDFSPRKPMCDVLVNGIAYAPGGKPIDRVTVSLQLGCISKSFDVVGDRVWVRGIRGPAPSRPKLFVSMPFSYDNAFGGVDDSDPDPAKLMTFTTNPVGRGYRPHRHNVAGKPLPNTQESDMPVTNPTGPYRPMAFGPLGRNWQPRAAHCGTYDQAWYDHKAPFWPDDFDDRYFQAAAEDQQIPFPSGPEQVALRNLTPQGFTTFRLPKVAMPVVFIPRSGEDRSVNAVVDTIVLEPHERRFTMTWRVSLALRRDIFELRETIVGEMPPGWHRARHAVGKRHFHGLGELVAARQRSPRRASKS